MITLSSHRQGHLCVLFPDNFSAPEVALITQCTPIGVCSMNEPYDAAIPLLGLCANVTLTHVHRVVCIRTRGANNLKILESVY